MKTTSAPTYTAQVYVAGPIDRAKEICAEYVMVGLCVTVSPTEFIYTGGREAGFVVGLVNYPRFPSTPEDIRGHAEELARRLMFGLFQKTALAVLPNETLWFAREDIERSA